MQDQRTKLNSAARFAMKSTGEIGADRIVFVVDDDFRVREALADLLASVGIAAVTFGTAAAYLAYTKPDALACVLLDVELPDINGLDLQRKLVEEAHPPIIFITGHGDIPKSVRAIKGGAIDFLSKPVGRAELLAALALGFAEHKKLSAMRKELAALKLRFASLTPREREVLPLVVSGLLNKQAAAQLGISEITFQIHRGQVMRKMAADSLADLVRMTAKLGV
jgi:FixJ family two-component response regulator